MASPQSVGAPTREPFGVVPAPRTAAGRSDVRARASGSGWPQEGCMPFFLLRSGVIDLVSPSVTFRAPPPADGFPVSAPMPVPFNWWGFRKGRVQ